MQKQHIEPGIETNIVFSDTPITRRLRASMKEGRIVLLDQNRCSVFYRNHHEICKLRDVDIRRDKSGYYVLI
jgi:hypothetical protein